MNYPKLNEIPTTRDLLDKFKGYNHNLRIGEGEFYDMKNLTGDDYPILSPRKKRGTAITTTNPNGMCSNTRFCYVDGQDFHMVGKDEMGNIDDTTVDLMLANSTKDLISIGSNVVIMPDQKYINTVDTSQKGHLRAGVFDFPLGAENKRAKLKITLLASTNEGGYITVVDKNKDRRIILSPDTGELNTPPPVYDKLSDIPEGVDRNTVVVCETGDLWYATKANLEYRASGNVDDQRYGVFYNSFFAPDDAKSIWNEGKFIYDHAAGEGWKNCSFIWSEVNGEWSSPWFFFPTDKQSVMVGIIPVDDDEEYTAEVFNQIGKEYILLEGIELNGAIKEFSECRGVNVEDMEDVVTKSGKCLVCSTTTDKIFELLNFKEKKAYAPAISDSIVTIELSSQGEMMPKTDYVIESGNRLWGCKYGNNQRGEFVNELYASRLGDFKDWAEESPLTSMSPYVINVGTSGKFTGAINYGGKPIFFKEDCMHRVFGDYTPYSCVATPCKGVQEGCSKSLAIVNDVLYYKSRTGICAYDGSLPVEISSNFGDKQYTDAVGGAIGNKYYISMKDVETGEHEMFVYDTVKKLWHKEDNTQATQFCNHQGNLYYIDYGDNRIHVVKGTGDGVTPEESVKWGAETGILGATTPDDKYVTKIDIRMSVAKGSKVSLHIEYDSMGEWERLMEIEGLTLNTFTIPVRPRRCDHFRLKFEGEGDAKIFSISKTLEESE